MNKKYIISALITTIITVGCSPSKDTAETEKEAVTKLIEKTQTAAKDSAMDLKAYTYEQKNEFVDAMKKQVATLETNIQELSTMIEKSSEEVKAEAKPKLAALREQSLLLSKQIEKIDQSTPSTWENIKSQTQQAYGSLKDSFNQARQWVSDKIEP
jgi:cytochrome c556